MDRNPSNVGQTHPPTPGCVHRDAAVSHSGRIRGVGIRPPYKHSRALAPKVCWRYSGYNDHIPPNEGGEAIRKPNSYVSTAAEGFFRRRMCLIPLVFNIRFDVAKGSDVIRGVCQPPGPLISGHIPLLLTDFARTLFTRAPVGFSNVFICTGR